MTDRYDGRGPFDLEAASLEWADRRRGVERREAHDLERDGPERREGERREGPECRRSSFGQRTEDAFNGLGMLGLTRTAATLRTGSDSQQVHQWGMDGRCQDCGIDRFSRVGLRDGQPCGAGSALVSRDPVGPDDGDPAELEARENPEGRK